MRTKSSNFEQGDVLVANIGYSDFSGTKSRPVLVISNTSYNKTSGNLIVLSISSSKIKSKYDAKLTQADLVEGELILESKIMADFPTTISKGFLSQKIARISEKKLIEVKEKMKELYVL